MHFEYEGNASLHGMRLMALQDGCLKAKKSEIPISFLFCEACDVTDVEKELGISAQVIPAEFLDQDTRYHVNPTGSFIIGGPHGDTGLTGRKIIVDTYGGWGRHGGGAFSGKDPTKVDRSAAYMARYIAKNVVAAGLAAECEVQLAYAIGVAEPVSVNLDCHGTATVSQEELEKLVGDVFPNNELTPAEIIESLDLRRPIYRKTAAGGHFGRNEIEFTWERTDRAELLREAMTLTQDAT